jgi:acyl-CoA thioester hydrolase
MIQCQCTIRVRYAETDMMGFVHHQNYVQYFEHARVELLDQIGYPYSELEKHGFFLPVLEVGIRYIQSNTFDDRLTVHCQMRKLPSVRIHLHYEVYRGDLLTTTGESKHAFIDRSGRPCRPPATLLERCAPYFESA